ncbi:2-phosphosulfolactate phosphatase [Oceanobacillus piezotolerans]|uniref:Probable 2-phosphosulfolactate phosphatase n=1 Tax=Oceanobacillus piezotolerans TaxID=2448030 RepID=A0A498DC80_9BACI|nr:2-phosphosulfolactate phosphatase [Oceanobacillus piezotolerans]RLL43731.1 2-phosphosulfolactate phosphatase [Oceanobacillus piezotolerans]
MQVNIYQGRTPSPETADITIVIDVIRAFTVAHYAFLQGAYRIFLAETVEQALLIKEKHPEYLLAGEVGGLPIEGFDLDNSPYHIKGENLKGKTLVQMTTNGVRATLNNLSSEQVFVTGFSNAKQTATFIKDNAKEKSKVNIIASHPSGDDDLACAEYINSILKGSDTVTIDEIIKRIQDSSVAQKFFDRNEPNFKEEDILLCTKELHSDFVMKVNKLSRFPMIERVNL